MLCVVSSKRQIGVHSITFSFDSDARHRRRSKSIAHFSAAGTRTMDAPTKDSGRHDAQA
jgi:hypothetical protein